MAGEEEHLRTVKWEKHKSIQRMDTALPNTFRRNYQFDTLVSKTTGYDVDQKQSGLQSNILDGNFMEDQREQEELPVLVGLTKLTSCGFREKEFTLGNELLEDIQKSEQSTNDTFSLLETVSSELQFQWLQTGNKNKFMKS